MSVLDIRAALVSAQMDLTPDVPIVYENLKPDFDPQEKDFWVKFTFKQNVPQVDSLGNGGLDRITGFVQLSLYNKVGSGVGPSLKFLDSLRKFFVAGKTLTYNGQSVVIANCGISESGEDSTWFVTYVTIYWWSWLQREEI